ncbi:unnamed protein product [Musa hybrid cultivar]
MQSLRPVSSLASFQRRKGEVDTIVWVHSAASQKNQWHCACGVKETGAVGSFPRCFFSFGSEKVDCAAGEFSYPGKEEGGKDPPSSTFLLQDPCTSCTILKAGMSKVSERCRKVLPVMDVDVKDHDETSP